MCAHSVSFGYTPSPVGLDFVAKRSEAVLTADLALRRICHMARHAPPSTRHDNKTESPFTLDPATRERITRYRRQRITLPPRKSI
jgi:hypothetical protein